MPVRALEETAQKASGRASRSSTDVALQFLDADLELANVGLDLLLGLLPLLDPALAVVGVGHIVLDRADGDHVLNAELLGNLGGSNQSVILAGNH